MKKILFILLMIVGFSGCIVTTPTPTPRPVVINPISPSFYYSPYPRYYFWRPIPYPHQNHYYNNYHHHRPRRR